MPHKPAPAAHCKALESPVTPSERSRSIRTLPAPTKADTAPHRDVAAAGKAPPARDWPPFLLLSILFAKAVENPKPLDITSFLPIVSLRN